MKCLSEDLNWQTVGSSGIVLSWTRLHTSLDSFFLDLFPLIIASIKLDCGPVIISHLVEDCAESGRRVSVLNRLDKGGQGIFIAIPEDEDPVQCLRNKSLLLADDY